MTEISVIVPVYRVEEYLSRCIDSILSQTFKDFELILVDDGSPDKCGAICDEYAEKDVRVRVLHKQNGGLSSARNAGLDIMQGKYVFFVDSDDWIVQNALEIFYESILRTGAKVVSGNIISVYEDGSIETFYEPTKQEIVLLGDEMLSTLSRPNAVNRLYDASIFETLRYPIGRLYEDVFVYHEIIDQIDCMVLTGKASYYYFVRQGSIMHMSYNIRFTDIVDAISVRTQWLEKIGKKDMANQSKLFVYSQVGVAFVHLDKRNKMENDRLREIKKIYDEYYWDMMTDSNITIKQKIRLIALYYCPIVHTILWGRNMPINLGG